MSIIGLKIVLEGCSWKVHASPAPDGSCLVFKTLIDKDTCQHVRKNRMAIATWIASRLAENFNDYPDLDCNGIRTILRKKYCISIPSTKLYRARCMSKGDTMHKHAKEYVMLRCYAHIVLKTNHGSLAKIKSKLLHTATPPVFERILICFNRSATGFVTGCRPSLEFDGCHLTGPYGGMLLSAIVVDANLQF